MSTTVFVVVSEDYYGSQDFVNIYLYEKDAEDYADFIGTIKNKDFIVVEKQLDKMCDVCYIVLSERWYGSTDLCRVFASKYDANIYSEIVANEHNLDVIVLKKQFSSRY